MSDTEYVAPMAIGAAQPITVLYLNTSGFLYPSALPLLNAEQDFNTVSGAFIIRPGDSMDADLNFLEYLHVEMWSLDDMGADIEHKGPVTFSLGGGGGPIPGVNFNLGALISDGPVNPSAFTTWNLKKITGKLIYGFRWTVTPQYITLGTVQPPQFVFVPLTNT